MRLIGHLQGFSAIRKKLEEYLPETGIVHKELIVKNERALHLCQGSLASKIRPLSPKTGHYPELVTNPAETA
jgi:hypothetical protein